MAVNAAYEKTLKIGSDEIPVSNASLKVSGEVLDDTNFVGANASPWRSRMVGLRDWSISLSGPLDAADTATAAIIAAALAGTAVTVYYLYDGTNGYTGSARVQSLNLEGEVAGLESFSCELVADGALAATP